MDGTQKKKRLIFAAALAALFALNLAMYGPLFSVQQRPYKGSIAAGYGGITRFIAEHPNPWGWNPQQYAGQPTQFTYPPILPYTASALHWVTGIEAFWAYRCVTGVLACLAPVSLALALYWLSGSRRWALALGIAYSVCSPAYGLFQAIDADRGLYYLPWRLLVLMKYGEGPHLVGLALLPLVLAAVVWGARRRDFGSLFLMAIALAIVPLINWLSAFALAITVLVLWISDWTLAKRTALAGLLGYGLSCFWLTPEYVATTLFNWPKDSYGYQVEKAHWPLYVGLVVSLCALRFVLGRFKIDWKVIFPTLAAWAFFWLVAGFYLYGRDTVPESRRYSLELELFLMVAVAAWLQWAWRSKEGVDKFCVALCVAAFLGAGMSQMGDTFKRRWSDWGIVDREQTLEYRLAQWLVEQKPRGRAFVTGGLRFRLNAWTRLQQVGGTFESGLRNRIAVDHYYQIRTGEASKPGEETMDALRQLTAIGVEYVVVHGLESEEYYKDYKNPEKFKGSAPVVFEATKNDWVHRVPFQGLAHLVKPSELPASQYKESLPPLHAALVDLERPKLKWTEEHPGRYRIEGAVRAGDEVFASMNFDPGWRATQDGAPLIVKPNLLGLIQLEAMPKASSVIVLEYAGTSQQKLFAGISAMVWIASMALWRRSKKWTSKAST